MFRIKLEVPFQQPGGQWSKVKHCPIHLDSSTVSMHQTASGLHFVLAMPHFALFLSCKSCLPCDNSEVYVYQQVAVKFLTSER